MIEKGEEPRSSAVKMKIRAKKQTAKEKNGGISRKIKNLRRDVVALLKQKFVKNVVQDLTSGGIDWQREKWRDGFGSKFIRQGEKNAVKLSLFWSIQFIQVLLEANCLAAGKDYQFKGRHDAKKEQYGQIYVEKFTSVSLICKAFYGKMKA